MAGPSSRLVLGSGAVLASPALWAALVDGTLPFGAAAVRLGVAVAVAWIGFSLLGSLVSSTAVSIGDPDAVPLALPATDGPTSVRGAVLDAQDDVSDPVPSTPTS